jgi:hypothetical protein
MIQCIICEDWYHGRHLLKARGDDKLPNDQNYAEMVCFQCCDKFKDIFGAYQGLSVVPVSKPNLDDSEAMESEAEATIVIDDK